MDAEPATGRPLPFTSPFTTLAGPPDALADPQYRRHSSRTDYDSERGRGLVYAPGHVQAFAGGFGSHTAPFGGGLAPFSDPGGPNNANATPVYASDTSFGPPSSSGPAHGLAFAPGDFNAHFSGDFYTFTTMSPPIAHPSSQPGSQGHESGGSSPSGSAHSQDRDSDQSGHSAHHSQRSASSHASTQEMSFGGAPDDTARQNALNFSGAERYPAYVNDRRIGLEHLRPDAQVHQNDGTTYYRTRTHTYPPSDEGPHVLNFSVGAPHQAHAPMSTTRSSERAPSFTGMIDSPMDFSSGPGAPHGAAMSPPPAPLGASALGSVDIPDSTPFLRQLLGLEPDEEVSLNALSDPPPGEKPNYPYPTLIKLAIHGSAKKRLTLQEIYEALKRRFEWYRLNANDKAWQNSIRHNLSLNRCFRRVERPITEPGKGDYWVVDYSSGEGNKRPRKRNKRPTRAQQQRAAQEQSRGREAPSSGSERAFTQSPTPGASSASQGSSTPFEGNIDPELVDQSQSQGQGQGHVVGQPSRRTTSIRDARRGTSPYAAPPPRAPPMHLGAQHQSLRGSRAPYPHALPQYGQLAYAPAPQQFGQFDPAFGQPAFNQPAFGQSSFAPPAPGPSLSRTGWAAAAPGSGQFMGPGMSTSGAGPSRPATSRSSPQGGMRGQGGMSSTSSTGSSTTSYGRQGGSGGRRSDSSSSGSSKD